MLVSFHLLHTWRCWQISDVLGSMVSKRGEIEMSENRHRRPRYGEAFWRAHYEAWMRSDLNQREYCAAQSLFLKAFGN